LILLVGAVLLGINTDPGRRFVADQLGGYTFVDGLGRHGLFVRHQKACPIEMYRATLPSPGRG
jgi:hypothetical protein